MTPPIEETWMKCPEPCSRRIGSAALVTHSAPNTLVSIWAREPSSSTSSIVPK